ncbi:redoxin domain-containing protein [Halococcus saccharolyticus]|uniref:Alkyl hydroperoxide reductase/ Thiol specific antioxidant/ Mal allergen n=1 Tax=Halococcus saccharolyticus DSM 5350 TaxID=1227455 RepID=M0MER6_9EURY|nr:redoxin domain-containing protein [Halococcus saccharolyticus]EMA44247.1 alkyl hydroperoxide reductase/ Thiol specific antioxidant/ Mal allergen [Halococcus saccharolyticus DSM 5350]
MAELDFDVVELDETDHPAAGDEAPDFVRPLVDAEAWADTALSDVLDDGPVVLVFHPMDGAFPATYVWNEIRDRGWTDEIAVVGLSISTPYAHKRLIAERGIDARLFSDPQNGVAEQYGIVNDLDGMAGVAEPRPAVFVIDDERTIQYAWVASEWPDFPDYDDVETAIDAL